MLLNVKFSAKQHSKVIMKILNNCISYDEQHRGTILSEKRCNYLLVNQNRDNSQQLVIITNNAISTDTMSLTVI